VKCIRHYFTTQMHDGLEGGENEVVDDDKRESVDNKCVQEEAHADGDEQDVVQDDQVVVRDGDVDGEMVDEGTVGKEDSGAMMEEVGREEDAKGGGKRNVGLKTGVGDTMGEGQVETLG
jgi:hypothetical protein